MELGTNLVQSLILICIGISPCEKSGSLLPLHLYYSVSQTSSANSGKEQWMGAYGSPLLPGDMSKKYLRVLGCIKSMLQGKVN